MELHCFSSLHCCGCKDEIKLLYVCVCVVRMCELEWAIEGVVYEKDSGRQKKKIIIKETVVAAEATDAEEWTGLIPPLYFSFSKRYHHDQQNNHEREGGSRKDRSENRTKAMNYNKPADCVFLLDCVTILSCQFHYTKGNDNKGRYLL